MEGRQSTVVVFALLTQQPWVQFSTFPKTFLSKILLEKNYFNLAEIY